MASAFWRSTKLRAFQNSLLEEIRLLANLESETQKLLRVVLAGQPALGRRLNEPAFRQLKQRVGLRCRLDALDLERRQRTLPVASGPLVGAPAMFSTRKL